MLRRNDYYEKRLDPDQEIEVSISSEDIANALAWELANPDKEQFETERNVFRAINVCAQFMKGISSEMVPKMSEGSRKVIADHFREQAERFFPHVQA